MTASLGGKYNSRQQATCSHIHEGYSNVITKTEIYFVKNLPIQDRKLYKPSPDIIIVDWLSRQTLTEDKEIPLSKHFNRYTNMHVHL